MEIRQVIYVSEAAVAFDRSQLVPLLKQARERNAKTGVTGVLLHSGDRFAQCIEGESATIATLYERIRADIRHSNVLTLHELIVPVRCFGAWTMGCVTVSDSELLRLGAADWKNAIDDHASRSWISPGFVIMEALWNAYRGSAPERQ